MEDEHQKSLVPLCVAFVSKESKLKGKKPFRGKQAKKGPHAPQNSRPRNGIAKKQKANGNRDKNIAFVKCYNCDKRAHYSQDCFEPSKVFPTKTPDIYVCSHAFVANCLPQWVVDTGATKLMVHGKAGFMEFHHYPMGSGLWF